MARILVIDDEYTVRRILRRLLERAGHEVAEASDGSEGIDICRQAPPNLVITDIIMPGKEGLETIRELRRDFPRIKIIAISGSGYRYLGCAEEFGALRTFSKPLDGEKMQKAVKELLEEEDQEV